jgi:hypothetical protein
MVMTQFWTVKHSLQEVGETKEVTQFSFVVGVFHDIGFYDVLSGKQVVSDLGLGHQKVNSMLLVL